MNSKPVGYERSNISTGGGGILNFTWARKVYYSFEGLIGVTDQFDRSGAHMLV